MKTEKVTTYIKSFSIGRRGENIARQIAFDLSDFVAEYGEGTPELIFQRPIDDKPYPVAAVRDGSILLWTVTDLDTAVATTNGGYSHCELRWYVGELLAKSRTWLVYVDTAMNVPSETVPPDPERSWVDQVISAGAAAKESADIAKVYADRAATLAADVSAKAAQAAQNASDAANAKEAAETAKRLAEEAQGAAETAQRGAEDAKTKAEASKEASAKSEAAAKLSEQNAKASEDVAKASEDNAAGSASVAADSATAAQAAQSGAEAAQSAAEQSAQEAAESAAVYDDVVADVNQLKDDVAAITPDDTTVDGKPWTSKKTVDSLCLPFEESGNPVQCYPVENYPLGVKVSWEPTQEGEGDPSPDNIRPITGRDSVTITHSNDAVSNDHNIALPETVYGGEVDAVSGEGLETWKTLTLNGTEGWTVAGKYLDDKTDWYYLSSRIPNAVNASPNKGNNICSHYPFAYVVNNNTMQGCAIVWGAIRVRWGDTIPDDAVAWKAYLAAKYAAGTPVQFAYKLATPTPFTATGAQPIPALSSVNTIFTDADGVVVTGAEDPKHTITELKNAIISLGGNV